MQLPEGCFQLWFFITKSNTHKYCTRYWTISRLWNFQVMITMHILYLTIVTDKQSALNSMIQGLQFSTFNVTCTLNYKILINEYFNTNFIVEVPKFITSIWVVAVFVSTLIKKIKSIMCPPANWPAGGHTYFFKTHYISTIL